MYFIHFSSHHLQCQKRLSMLKILYIVELYVLVNIACCCLRLIIMINYCTVICTIYKDIVLLHIVLKTRTGLEACHV
jgi:hypothetical protein